jgi:hypothetical protein
MLCENSITIDNLSRQNTQRFEIIFVKTLIGVTYCTNGGLGRREGEHDLQNRKSGPGNSPAWNRTGARSILFSFKLFPQPKFNITDICFFTYSSKRWRQFIIFFWLVNYYIMIRHFVSDFTAKIHHFLSFSLFVAFFMQNIRQADYLPIQSTNLIYICFRKKSAKTQYPVNFQSNRCFLCYVAIQGFNFANLAILSIDPCY